MKSRFYSPVANRLETGVEPEVKVEIKPDIDPILMDWVRLHAYQLRHENKGIERHTQELKALGQSAERLHELEDWRHSHLFTRQERAALALCEALVSHPGDNLARGLLQRARRYFSNSQLISITMTVMTIINWNHLAASHLLVTDHATSRMVLHRIE
ncbi:MAG: hypothetical protein LV479_02840 [Methylacidiphilales bacterium]|nr:hypothetical protein [Candidatus Methylacidiphilales bacterium]